MAPKWSSKSYGLDFGGGCIMDKLVPLLMAKVEAHFHVSTTLVTQNKIHQYQQRFLSISLSILLVKHYHVEEREGGGWKTFEK